MKTWHVLAFVVYSLVLFFFGRQVGRVEQRREVSTLQQTVDRQAEAATRARLSGPIVRVGLVNARLRQLLKRHGIDAEKEGVYAK